MISYLLQKFTSNETFRFIEYFIRNPIVTVLLLIIAICFFYLEYNSKIAPPCDDNKYSKQSRYPIPPKDMISKNPKDSVILGKYKNRYLFKSLNEQGHVVIIGGSGSGKSSCVVIPSILTMSSANYFCIDVKGELSRKSGNLNNPDTIIVNPLNHDSYGIDPFFRLSSASNITEQLVYETMEEIVFSLIPLSNSKDPFWILSGRTLLLGLFIYYYRMGYKNIIQIVDAIQMNDIHETFEQIQNNISEDKQEYRLLSQFFHLSDATLGSIYTTALQKISVLTTDTHIRYALSDNPHKFNPIMLEEGKSIYLTIPEEYLARYTTIIHLCINQIINILSKRPEDAKPLFIMIDEAVRLCSVGKISELVDGFRTLRSRNITIAIVVQSIEGLQTAYSPDEVTDMISNAGYIVVLSANSEKTIHQIQSWCGKFSASTYSYTQSNTGTNETISFREKPLIESNELALLPQYNEVVLITPKGYFRLKKTPYFKDKHFLDLHKLRTKTNHLSNLSKLYYDKIEQKHPEFEFYDYKKAQENFEKYVLEPIAEENILKRQEEKIQRYSKRIQKEKELQEMEKQREIEHQKFLEEYNKNSAEIKKDELLLFDM